MVPQADLEGRRPRVDTHPLEVHQRGEVLQLNAERAVPVAEGSTAGAASCATRYDHQQERGFDFWVMRDPWGNEFCVLQPNLPELLARRPPWPT